MKAVLRGAGVYAIALFLVALTSCGTTPTETSSTQSASGADAAPPPSARKGGGYYLDDGPGDAPPPNLDQIADATPRHEPLHRYANKTYRVMGRTYSPIPTRQPFNQRGTASWYGKRFHGQKTSSGELYDMYAMTAAHPTLPIPSYVRVVNLNNGRSVVVRVNDRGPFLHDRVIDLSYAAAHRLGYVQQGSAPVEIEVVMPPAEDEATAMSEAPARAAGSGDTTGLFLQLGAFSTRGKAEELKSRVATLMDDNAAALSVVRGDGLYRVHLGPYKSRDEATKVSEQLRSRLDLQPHLITR